jgi:hypothetical protein
MGKSPQGRNLFLVTVADPSTGDRFGNFNQIRNLMVKDPEAAQALLDSDIALKIPVFINAGVHGNEYTGVDAVIRLIETLAYGQGEDVRLILDNTFLLVNVVHNPDGRVMGIKSNGNRLDLGRDLISQTQPETQALVDVLVEQVPTVFIDLHDDFNPMLIEPATSLHNPNYEYDLYLKWALPEAEAMEAELVAQTDETLANIPYRDWDHDVVGWAWSDWAPAYPAQYAMFAGSYGHTVESPYEDSRGVDAHYAAVWGALKYVATHKKEMLRDQIEVFRRGELDLPQALIPDALLARAQDLTNQYNELTIKEFPGAYVIPASGPHQLSEHQPAYLIDFLLVNGIEVEKASQEFSVNGVTYPKGAYVIPMDQPRRGFANTVLEDGVDISAIDLPFYDFPAAWSHPLLWGVSRAKVIDALAVATHPIGTADKPKGKVTKPSATAFAYRPTSLSAYRATNDLLALGTVVYRSAEAFQFGAEAFGVGTFIFNATPAIANKLANDYALGLFGLDEVPEAAVQLSQREIAVFNCSGDTVYALEELGFKPECVWRNDLPDGLGGYDVLVHCGASGSWSSLSADQQAGVAAFVAGGGDFIGCTRHGNQFAVDAGLIGVGVSVEFEPNGIVRLAYTQSNPVAAGFSASDYAFVDEPSIFGSLSTGVETVAEIADDASFLGSGYWPGSASSSAKGSPVIVETSTGGSHVTLFGIEPAFRGHTRNTFRLLGNAVFADGD